jgi:hypothetical protein
MAILTQITAAGRKQITELVLKKNANFSQNFVKNRRKY